MQNYDPSVFIAVLQEILGGFFWPLVVFVIVGALAFFYVLIRDRGLVSARFVWSELVGLLGGVFAIWFTFAITSSSFADIGGPIDWVLLMVLFVLGAIGGTIVTYVILGLLSARKSAA
ncbi:MAG: DUF5368 domain-containing protein [Xanthobacter sp.]